MSARSTERQDISPSPEYVVSGTRVMAVVEVLKDPLRPVRGMRSIALIQNQTRPGGEWEFPGGMVRENATLTGLQSRISSLYDGARSHFKKPIEEGEFPIWFELLVKLQTRIEKREKVEQKGRKNWLRKEVVREVFEETGIDISAATMREIRWSRHWPLYSIYADGLKIRGGSNVSMDVELRSYVASLNSAEERPTIAPSSEHASGLWIDLPSPYTFNYRDYLQYGLEREQMRIVFDQHERGVARLSRGLDRDTAEEHIPISDLTYRVLRTYLDLI